MKLGRRCFGVCAGLGIGWLSIGAAVGVIAGEGALHPVRRDFTAQDESSGLAVAQRDDARLISASIRASDGVSLAGWRIEPMHWNGDYVLLLHGQSDNRAGMLGPADVLLRHGYGVLLPDARAHGASGGGIATYGVLESTDVRLWFEWLRLSTNAHCIDAIGDSMGAGQVLASLRDEPNFCAVIADSPFSSFREAAYDRMGQELGTSAWAGRTILRPAVELWLLYSRWRYGIRLDRGSPADSVAESHVPVLLIHGLEDNDLPPRHSQLILAQAHGRNPNVAFWEPANAGHCGAISADPDEYERRVIDWLQTHGTDAKRASSRAGDVD